MTNLPPPPTFKPTIIQIKGNSNTTNDNFEISTSHPSYNDDSNSNSNVTTTRKRRRSSTNSMELEKRKKEHKAAHSIIEKKRRVKMNREFEALKYLVPACRNSNSSNSKTQTESTSVPSSTSVSNNGKIDGMYKLTILQASVEYIKYLHFIINQQNTELKTRNPEWNFDDGFTKFNLNLNDYRDIEKEFNFHELPKGTSNESPFSQESSHNEISVANFSSFLNNPKPVDNYLEDINEETYNEEYSNDYQFGSKTLKRYQNMNRPSTDSLSEIQDQGGPLNINASPMNRGPNRPKIPIIQLPTPEITPDISPIMSQLLKDSNYKFSNSEYCNSTNNSFNNKQYLDLISKLKFNLPDPMLKIDRDSNSSVISDAEELINADEASKALLLLKKTSIGSLLN